MQGHRVVENEADAEDDQQLPSLLDLPVLAPEGPLHAQHEVGQCPQHEAVGDVRPLNSCQDGRHEERSCQGSNKYLLDVLDFQDVTKAVLLLHFLISGPLLEQHEGDQDEQLQ